jgi:hypothetical protein
MKRIAACLAVALLVPACGDEGDTIIVQGAGGRASSFAPGVLPAVIYRADTSVDESYELYATDIDGTTLVNLSSPLVAGGSVSFFSWSPDRQWVAFEADKDTNDVVEVYVVPASGGTPVKVSGPMTAGGDALLGFWAPDSSRLFYLADQDSRSPDIRGRKGARRLAGAGRR